MVDWLHMQVDPSKKQRPSKTSMEGMPCYCLGGFSISLLSLW